MLLLWAATESKESIMLQSSVISAAIQYIQDLFRAVADGHDAEHTYRVFRNAKRIAEAYPNADQTVISLAALLHDADDHKLFQTENNANARQFLMDQQIDPEMIDRICDVINAVSFSKNRGKSPATIEAMIVQDADRLDAIGAIGIARTFAFGGSHGRPLDDSIAHFYEKLLLIKDLMNTPEARKLAEERHALMERFLFAYEKEVKNLDEPLL